MMSVSGNLETKLIIRKIYSSTPTSRRLLLKHYLFPTELILQGMSFEEFIKVKRYAAKRGPVNLYYSCRLEDIQCVHKVPSGF
jgi:hypothetical protein